MLTNAQGKRRWREIASIAGTFSLGIAVVVFAAGPLRGQVVQLPSWRVFSVNTSVLVPDQGTAWLGGVSSGSVSSARYGPWRRGPWGGFSSTRSAMGSGTTSVSATILDHQQRDAALLAEARAARHAPGPFPRPEDAEAAWMTEHLSRPGQEVRLSVAELQASAAEQRARQRQFARVEAERLLEHGDECFARGDYRLAGIFYRNAMAPEPTTSLRTRLPRVCSTCEGRFRRSDATAEPRNLVEPASVRRREPR